MPGRTGEADFEATVVSMLTDVGWVEGDRAEWDVDLALFPDRVVAFLRSAQPEPWAEMVALHGSDLEERIVAALVRELDTKGALDVLRHGFKFYGKTHRLAWFKPAHGLNPAAIVQFASNELTVTRQARCHPGGADTVDLVMALNGVPVATCELKNPSTAQHWRHAVRQYREDRNPKAPLFRFGKRALVHFAADTDEVHMTTRLAGGETRFLPFNRGSHPGEVKCGAGNPQHPSGYRTGYFWQEVLERECFLGIIGSYMFLERREDKVTDAKGTRAVKRETLIFPRYHQLDSVSRLVEVARDEGAGHNYLVQHSAGSGKTNSISWLAHRLSSLHDDADEKVFDCVLVITDRRVLDAQLQQAIYQIEHTQGVVQAIDQDSAQLAQALVDGTKIVITTLQKFPFVMRQLLRLAGADPDAAPGETAHAQAAEWAAKLAARKYAVIVDEAHSSQTGESAHDMKSLLGAAGATADDESPQDWEDGLNAVVASRGRQPNLSFFAFTATPKGKTIELFGRPGPDGKPVPFHTYSMRQAIEEGFILDVLGNFTDYDTFFRLVKTAEDDPEFPRREAAKKLAKYSQLHAHRLEQQTAVIVEHFREHVRPCMGGRAKAMVVASSRLHAVRYMEAFTKYLSEQGYDDVRPLVAFSGSVSVPGLDAEYTEPKMNIDVVTGKPISESALPERFASPDYQILIVAEKYQTGFDQPLLQAMYVDRPLSGVHAVQALSRLNRVATGKQAPFVLDFVNSPADIADAFAPYFDATRLRAISDPYQLDRLKHELDGMQVYHETEIEQFAQVFYLPPHLQRTSDHPRIEASLRPGVDRFAGLDEDAQTEFRDRLSAYVRLYAFLSQIIPYADCDLERLYSYGRKLLPHLHVGGDFTPVRLDGDVDLEYYRLQRTSSGAISLDDETGATVASPTAVGTRSTEDGAAPLSEIIDLLNDRYKTDFTESDRLFLQQIQEDGLREEAIRETARANDFDKFRLGAYDRVKQLLIARLAGNDAIVDKCLSDPEFGDFVITGILQSIFDTARSAESATAKTPSSASTSGGETRDGTS
ncbi:MAG: type I restriction endonuclease subunit R [Acidimicrobiales bacterium]|nr:type I restriction endonuclease subunit R [Acidimicrobiales bacterium]MYI09348.1 type I restriction endonuclease subunit R [Acidimicrobiales bacterium]